MRYKSHLPKDKIIFKLAILIAIEVLLVVSSFGISTYIQSQSTTTGNTINVAGKNRYLTSNYLLELEKVNHSTAQIQDLRNAADALNTNILSLKSGGDIDSSSGYIFLTPLSVKYLDKWNDINKERIALNQYVGLLSQRYNTIGTAPNDNTNNNNSGSINGLQQLPSPLSSPTKGSSNEDASIVTIASHLIASSDDLARQLGEDDRVNSQNLVAMQTIFIIGAVVVGIIILYVMKRLLRPISLIIKATEEVKKGNLDISPVPHCDSKDEVGVLAASFNSMIKKLAEYDQIQKEFINIAAHELRTPIQPILGLSTIIREGILNLGKQSQMMQGDAVYKELKDTAATTNTAATTFSSPLHPTDGSPLSPSIEKMVPMVDAINRNAKRLEKMTSNLLDLSRIENNKSLELSKEKFDLRKKIENVINDMRSTIPANKDVRIRFEPRVNTAASVMIEGDRERIYEVISNLLNNAIKITEKGEIVVVLDEKDDQAIVSVSDSGRGIDPQIYPNLFNKFVTKSEKGTGLGLFISKNIIEAHGGKIWAENHKDGMGATFSFNLPTLTYNTSEGMINEKR
jgi:signal transduction histidine kinase